MKFSSSNIEELQAFDEICWKLQNYTGYSEEQQNTLTTNSSIDEASSLASDIKSRLKMVTTTAAATEDEKTEPDHINDDPAEDQEAADGEDDLDQLVLKLLDLSHKCEVTVSSLHIGK